MGCYFSIYLGTTMLDYASEGPWNNATSSSWHRFCHHPAIDRHLNSRGWHASEGSSFNLFWTSCSDVLYGSFLSHDSHGGTPRKKYRKHINIIQVILLTLFAFWFCGSSVRTPPWGSSHDRPRTGRGFSMGQPLPVHLRWADLGVTACQNVTKTATGGAKDPPTLYGRYSSKIEWKLGWTEMTKQQTRVVVLSPCVEPPRPPPMSWSRFQEIAMAGYSWTLGSYVSGMVGK